eukprot:scaffold6247_cov416-Prasinococcus_capsulatus_cf.AAC.11
MPTTAPFGCMHSPYMRDRRACIDPRRQPPSYWPHHVRRPGSPTKASTLRSVIVCFLGAWRLRCTSGARCSDHLYPGCTFAGEAGSPTTGKLTPSLYELASDRRSSRTLSTPVRADPSDSYQYGVPVAYALRCGRTWAAPRGHSLTAGPRRCKTLARGELG